MTVWASINWKPAKHPVYGDIEIGGFDAKFFGLIHLQNILNYG